MGPPPRATAQAMPTNKPGRAAGRAPSSTATARSAPRTWRTLSNSVIPDQQVAGRLVIGSSTDLSSPTRIQGSVCRWPAPDYAWSHYLQRPKPNAGSPLLQGAKCGRNLALRRPLPERPARSRIACTPGHWEADLMLFRIYGQAILTLHGATPAC